MIDQGEGFAEVNNADMLMGMSLDDIYAYIFANVVVSWNTRQGAVVLTLADVTGVGGAPIASPTFTGDPKAPTASPGDNDTSIATTAFVTAAVGGAISAAGLSVKGNATNVSAPMADIVAGSDGQVLRRSGTTLGFGTVATAGLATNSVDNTIIRDSGPLSVVGRSANSSGDPADISASAASGAVLRESGSVLGFGTIATAGIANDAVDDTKIRNSGALSVIGRTANTSGDPADISAVAASGAVLRESGSTIGFGTIVTAGIANNAVDGTKIRDSAALSVIGNATNSSADPADIAAGSDGQVLRRSGTTLGFGTVATAGLATDSVDNTILRNSGALSVIGRSANSSGDPADISAVAASGAVLRESGSTIGFGTVVTAGIAANAVDNTIIRDSGALSVIGRSANSSGDPADISATAAGGGVLKESGSTLTFATIVDANVSGSAAIASSKIATGTSGALIPLLNGANTWSATQTINALLDISGASGGQIKFPATQNASADANTLDDYEEGTFTPAVAFGGSSTGVTYSTQDGTYTKIGRQVSIAYSATLTNNGSATGSATLTGLPFNAGKDVPGCFFGAVASSVNNVVLRTQNSSATMNIYSFASGVATQLTDTTLPDTAILRAGCVYSV